MGHLSHHIETTKVVRKGNGLVRGPSEWLVAGKVIVTIAKLFVVWVLLVAQEDICWHSCDV